MTRNPNLLHMQYFLKHKWYVLRYGLMLGAPLPNLIIHDLSKLTAIEWGPYTRKFYPKSKSPTGARRTVGYFHKEGDNTEFDIAWKHHWQSNPHHWQFWTFKDNEVLAAAPMPFKYVLEMVADWAAAGRAQGVNDLAGWWASNKDHIVLHGSTQAQVEVLVAFLHLKMTGRVHEPQRG